MYQDLLMAYCFGAKTHLFSVVSDNTGRKLKYRSDFGPCSSQIQKQLEHSTNQRVHDVA